MISLTRRVAAIVLAAGLSSRMAPRNKLLIKGASGLAMVARVTASALASRAFDVVVVTGHQAEQVVHAVGAVPSLRQARFVHAEQYELGLSASLRAGVAALPPEAEAVVVCLGDMPLVLAPLLDRLIDAYDPAAGYFCVVPCFCGTRGNPVLWGKRVFPEIMALTGDVGARSLLKRYPAEVLELELGDAAVLRDFDTPAEAHEGGFF